MSYQRWDKQKVADYILAEYKKRGSDLRCTHAPSRIRQLVIDYWGGWRNALSALNIQIEEKSNKPYIKLEETEGSIRVLAPKESTQSICWRCFRPISPQENYCPWHDHFEVPENAIFFKTLKTSTNPPSQIVTIVNCPLFIEETKELRKKKHEADIRQASYMRAQLMAAAYDK